MSTSTRTIAYFRADPEDVKKHLESVQEGGKRAEASRTTQYEKDQRLMIRQPWDLKNYERKDITTGVPLAIEDKPKHRQFAGTYQVTGTPKEAKERLDLPIAPHQCHITSTEQQSKQEQSIHLKLKVSNTPEEEESGPGSASRGRPNPGSGSQSSQTQQSREINATNFPFKSEHSTRALDVYEGRKIQKSEVNTPREKGTVPLSTRRITTRIPLLKGSNLVCV